MPSDPFVILGIKKGASQSEILEAYKSKRAVYEARIFSEGEEGADAAKMLETLDNAYQAAMEYTHESASVSGEPQSFEEVKQAIRDKNPERAQQILDGMTYRGGEWHYYQSVVFYEKNWLSESKKQLEIALELEPDNDKYRRALDNLKKKIDGGTPFNQSQQQQNNGGYAGNMNGNPNTYTQTERTYQQQQPDAADGCCAACQTLWCADCCCECMGGDLIRCC